MESLRKYRYSNKRDIENLEWLLEEGLKIGADKETTQALKNEIFYRKLVDDEIELFLKEPLSQIDHQQDYILIPKPKFKQFQLVKEKVSTENEVFEVLNRFFDIENWCYYYNSNDQDYMFLEEDLEIYEGEDNED